MKISVNGKIVDEKEATISVFDRGYLFGEGIFETLRSYKGKVPFLDLHLERMEWSATFIGIPFPHPGQVKKQIEDLLAINQLKDARVKILLSAVGQKMSPQLVGNELNPNFIIAVDNLGGYSETDRESGLSLCTIHEVKNDPAPASNLKSTSWLSKLIARREFAEKDCDDGIMLSADGHVTETTSANLFWIEGDTVCTTPVNMGLLPGIARKIVIDLAKDQGWQVTERIIRPETLRLTREVFITNSLIEVVGVTEIDGLQIGNGKPGKKTQELQVAFKQRVQEEIAEAMD